jgi:hypothetical protein
VSLLVFLALDVLGDSVSLGDTGAGELDTAHVLVLGELDDDVRVEVDARSGSGEVVNPVEKRRVRRNGISVHDGKRRLVGDSGEELLDGPSVLAHGESEVTGGNDDAELTQREASYQQVVLPFLQPEAFDSRVIGSGLLRLLAKLDGVSGGSSSGSGNDDGVLKTGGVEGFTRGRDGGLSLLVRHMRGLTWGRRDERDGWGERVSSLISGQDVIS